MKHPVIFFAAIYGFLAVMLGAFGAHGLKSRVDAQALAWWHTGVQYHFWHALALLGIGLLLQIQPKLNLLFNASLIMQLGIILFSGSLYALTLGAPRWVGIITPFGGLCFLIAWILLAAAAYRLEVLS